MDRNEHGEPVLTGNETTSTFADLLADLLGRALTDEFCGDGNPRIEVAVEQGFQPYLTIRLGNGAEWQVTPVRSSWPTDGTSAQFAHDDEPEVW